MMNNKQFLTQLFNHAVTASLPSVCLPPFLNTLNVSGKVCVIGAGKASVEMAQAVVKHFGARCFGAVVTRHGYTSVTHIGNIEILRGGHPLPDEHSAISASKILTLAKNIDSDIPVVFLISGGGSALLSLPITGVSLEDKIAVNQFLLGCGASIDEINTVRTHLSAIKGGKLAQAIKGTSHTFIISDVVGDDPHIIASGPTVSCNSNSRDALAILEKYQWTPNTAIINALRHNTEHKIKLRGDENKLSIVSNAKQALDYATNTIDATQYNIVLIDYELTGDAHLVAQEHAKLAIAAKSQQKPTLLVSGGELTVTLNRKDIGDGGPNQHYLLSLADALYGETGICALACDTDGIDGSVDVAGAFIDETTLLRAKNAGLDVKNALARCNSYRVFKTLDDLIVTGPTHTNVNDFRVIMVTP